MKFPKEFIRVSGQKVRLQNTGIYIYQWNTGKSKNFMVENINAPMHTQSCFTIPGKGDSAMSEAIKKAYSLNK